MQAIDSDYRGEVGVVFFSFGEKDFETRMVNKITQLNFEKMKTAEIKEVESLDEMPHGDGGYNSTENSSKSPRPIQYTVYLSSYQRESMIKV